MLEKPDLSTLKVLVIDDETFMLGLLVRALRGVGIDNVFKAKSCDEAVRTIARNALKLDCIIADFNMRPLNGLQFLQRIRTGQESSLPRDQPFIVLTGNAQSEVVASSVALDANGFLVKPVPASKLREAIERVVGLKWTLKNPEHYKAASIVLMETFHDAEGGRRGPSVVLPGQRAFKPAIEESFLERKTTADPSSATPTRKTRGKAPTLVPHKCTLAELKERMVLGEDIAAPNGKVLLGRGTALSLRMIGRLREVVADREFVWILKEE